MAVLRRRLLPNMQYQCCMILQGTLGGNFDIFAASGEPTAWVLLWKTVQDQLAQFNFSVLWKEDLPADYN